MKPNILASVFILAIVTVFAFGITSQSVYAADHREAPALTDRVTGDVFICPAPLLLPILTTVSVPRRLLGNNNIYVKSQTKTADGNVDGADFLIWQRQYGSTLPSVSDPGPDQFDQTYYIFPTLKKQGYQVKFMFESIADGESCEIISKVEPGVNRTAVKSWSISGEGDHTSPR